MAFENKLTEALNKKTWIIPLIFGFMCFFLISSITAIEIRGFENLNPKFAFSIGGELFAMLISIVITASILPAYKRQSGYIRIFVTLLSIGCFSMYFDTIQMIVDSIPELVILNRVICVFVFASETVFTFFFWLYITYVLKIKSKIGGIFNLLASIFLVVFYILPFINFFYPLYFSIDADGVYHRITNTWWICRIYIVMIVLFVIISLILSKEKISLVLSGVFRVNSIKLKLYLLIYNTKILLIYCPIIFLL